MEISSGYLKTSLPSNLVNVTEIKMRTSYQWQPLQTFVSIEKHFTVKAKGIRFRGTIAVCNNVMQHLFYHVSEFSRNIWMLIICSSLNVSLLTGKYLQGGKHDVVLTVRVNDMGNYGCYPNCNENMSMSLSAVATINLVKGRLMSSLLAHCK